MAGPMDGQAARGSAAGGLGMALAASPRVIILDDLRTTVGTLLVPKGFEVTETFLQRIRNFDSALLQSKIRVMTATAIN